MNNLIQGLKDVKSILNKNIRIPFIYIVFLFDLILLSCNNVRLIFKINGFIPNNIKKLLLQITDLFNQFSSGIIIFLVISFLSFLFAAEYLSKYFDKIRPKNIYFDDGTVGSWNIIAPVKRIFKIILFIMTYLFIICLTVELLIKDYNSLNFSLLLNKNYLITYLSLFTCFSLLFFYTLKSLFYIEIKDYRNFIELNNINMYIVINSSKISHKSDDELTNDSKYNKEIVMLKNKYSEKTQYILGIKKTLIENSNIMNMNTKNTSDLKNLKQNQGVYIKNRSDNFDEIIYHFNALKE